MTTFTACGGGGSASTVATVPTPQVVSYTVKPQLVTAPQNCPTTIALAGGCVDINQQANMLNVVAPEIYKDTAFFTQKTGTIGVVHTNQWPTDPYTVETHSFVQTRSDAEIGIYVNGIDRNTPVPATSINPIYHFKGLMPWKAANPDIELSFGLLVKTMRRTDKVQGMTQSHPVIELIDTVSNDHLYITLGVAAIIPQSNSAETDFFAKDFGVGTVIVSTTFRTNPSFGVRVYGETFACDTDVAPCPTNTNYRFRLRPQDISYVINKARTLNPLLSPNIADYAIDNFSFNNEVNGLAEVGVTINEYTLSIINK